MSGVTVTTTVNGDPVQYVCPADESLLDVLRNRLNMTGSKEGWEQGIVALAVSPWMAGWFVRAWCSVQRPKAKHCNR